MRNILARRSLLNIRDVAGVGVVLAALAGTYTALAGGAGTTGVRFTRLLKVGTDVVFSYARISGDGRFLVYSSQPDAGLGLDTFVLRVVDLDLGNTIYTDSGIDGYWSPDGTVLVYLARRADNWHAATWNRVSGARQLVILPFELGDYYSIGGVAGANVLLTINGWYVGLSGDQVTSAPARMPGCPVVGIGERPLVSRDGTRASVFIGERVILRNLRDCAWLLDTGVIGGKADWSARGTHVAMHSPKASATGYEIAVFDVASGGVRRLSGLEGDSYFPSWTDDDGLVFRYEGPEYNGFVRADAVPASEAATRPNVSRFGELHTIARDWARRLPPGPVIVLIWATWGAHSAEALAELAAVGDTCRRLGCSLVAAYDPTSAPRDVTRMTRLLPSTVQMIEAPWSGMESAGGFNQTPTYLLFDEGCLVSRQLGAKSRRQLEIWIARHLAGASRESMPTTCLPDPNRSNRAP